MIPCKKCLIVYQGRDEIGTEVLGNLSVELTKFPPTIAEVEKIKNEIGKMHPGFNIIIFNWLLLGDE